jgi:hypothetical protein
MIWTLRCAFASRPEDEPRIVVLAAGSIVHTVPQQEIETEKQMMSRTN